MPTSSRAFDFIGACLAGVVLASLAAAADTQVVVTREEWGAKPPVKDMPAHSPVRITVHHTASPGNARSGLAAKLKSLQAFSQTESKLADGRVKKAWGDIPYHYYIDVKGAVGEGRDVKFAGDTNTKYDPAGHIGIVVEGNFERETPSDAQVEALIGLIAMLAKRHGVDMASIGVHRQFAQTACPGKNLLARMPEILDAVNARLERDG